MGLATTIRNGVATAHRLTGGVGGVQMAVQVRSAAGPADTYGVTPPSAPVARTALYEAKVRVVQSAGGQEQTAIGVLTFLDGLPVHLSDTVTLADGSMPPILSVAGLADDLGAYVTQAWLGASPSRGTQ